MTLSPIRLATPEEIEKIKDVSDLHDGCTVLAFGEGDKVDFAVLRHVVEVDPVMAPDGRRKALLMWGIENMLRFQGVQRYYFNISPNDETWKSVLNHWGAHQVSTEPELRFRKNL